MTPEKPELFLGLHVSKELAALIDSLPAEKRDLYIQPSGEYLSEVHHDNKRFIGKACGNKIDFEAIKQLETNIITMLNKIDPNLNESSLTLFPLIA